jgi:integral membrane sensor domain MASE1
MAHNLTPFEEELRALAASVRLALAGAGVSPALAEAVGAELLEMDPVSAAEHLAG